MSKCCGCGCDKKLAKKAAWKYILMKESSYSKVAKELGISATRVGTLLREDLPTISTFLSKLVLHKKKKNEKRSRDTFTKNNSK